MHFYNVSVSIASGINEIEITENIAGELQKIYLPKQQALAVANAILFYASKLKDDDEGTL